MCYIDNDEYDSAIKRNNLLIDTTWMNLKNIVLSEKSQTQKTMCCIISLISKFWKITKVYKMHTDWRLPAPGDGAGSDYLNTREHFGVVKILEN